jgi:SAM-dependent methyltransferase
MNCSFCGGEVVVTRSRIGPREEFVKQTCKACKGVSQQRHLLPVAPDERQPNGVDFMVRSRYGFLPTSVWHEDKNSALMAYVSDKLRGSATGGNPLSEFNPTVADHIIRYWSEPNDWVLDPFAGRTRALIAKTLGRNYVGFEISPSAHEQITSRLFGQKTIVPNGTLQVVVLGDCRRMAELEGKRQFDLVFSCPPYFDVEVYDEVPGELSHCGSYEAFLIEYEKIIAQAARLLKPGKFAVWVVNDWRRNGRWFDFHGDSIRAWLKAGLVQHDVVINVLDSASRMGIGGIALTKNVAKMHEYILIFRKPEVN